ncbi:hypothetical protein A5742_09920 [Mycolicibacterium fortuitum]|uniref:Uncharacterized protein n=1 Tax=Mycolicibacterium fortuitum TaxID=1766 RepID=A0ABD6QFY2_MYCFO|nr:hypothetical protein A5742_09920 [Mycolicibacterium fortuitum]
MSSLPPDPFGPASAAGAGAPQPWQQSAGPGGSVPGGPAPWGSQQQWAGGLAPSSGGGKVKWVLGGLAVVLAIALAVVVTVLVVKPAPGTPAGPPNAGGDSSTSELASANDTGPITIITEDPSCAAWTPIQSTMADSTEKNWGSRDPSIPASRWSPDQRAQYEAVAQAMLNGAEQAKPLAKLTPHRVMRELYEQFIAYTRAFAGRVPTYTSSDDALARTAITAAELILNICEAAKFGSASARAPLVPAVPTSDNAAQPQDPADPQRFLASPNPTCPDWQTTTEKFRADTADWEKTDPNIPVGQWSPEQKSLNDEVATTMRESADALEALGRRSDNPVVDDFAVLAAQYRRAYVAALPTYQRADKYLYKASLYPTGVILEACNAVTK